MFIDFKTSFPQVTVKSLSQIPVKILNSKVGKEKLEKNRVIGCVTRMLNLHNQRNEALTSIEKSDLQEQIDETDREIDRLVYQLYGLSDDEIKLIEEE